MASTLTSDRGCLLLADISGYTNLLMDSELSHAEDALNDLLKRMVETLEPVLTISKLEGDAAFAYVLAGSFGASTLLDTIDRTYNAFRSRLRDISLATTCTCRACELLPTLDLKVVVHDGEFIRRDGGGWEELVGRDVILIHRLLKNSAAEALGTRGYLLLTQTCVDVIGIDPTELGFVEHAESYGDVGEVGCWLQDLGARWQEEQERRRVRIVSEGASFEVVYELPVGTEEAWEWLTSPARRGQWMGAQVVQAVGAGRILAGTTNHCMHGEEVTVEEVVDWRPFDYFTVRYEFPLVGQMLWTTELAPIDGGTQVSLRGEGFDGERAEGWAKIQGELLPVIEMMSGALRQMVQAEQAVSTA